MKLGVFNNKVACNSLVRVLVQRMTWHDAPKLLLEVSNDFKEIRFSQILLRQKMKSIQNPMFILFYEIFSIYWTRQWSKNRFLPHATCDLLKFYLSISAFPVILFFIQFYSPYSTCCHDIKYFIETSI